MDNSIRHQPRHSSSNIHVCCLTGSVSAVWAQLCGAPYLGSHSVSSGCLPAWNMHLQAHWSCWKSSFPGSCVPKGPGHLLWTGGHLQLGDTTCISLSQAVSSSKAVHVMHVRFFEAKEGPPFLVLLRWNLMLYNKM